jgi:hypothetical protein
MKKLHENDVTAEITKMKNEIETHMTEKIEPILKGFKKIDGLVNLETTVFSLERTIWFHYKLDGDEVKSFSFNFMFSEEDLCVLTRFHCIENGFTIEKEKNIEKILNSLNKEVKKYVFSLLYDR